MNYLFFVVFTCLSILPLVAVGLIELFTIGAVATIVGGVPAGSFEATLRMAQLTPVTNSIFWFIAPLLLATTIAAFIPTVFDAKRDLLFKLQRSLLWRYLKFKIPGTCILVAMAICFRLEGWFLLFLASFFSIALGARLILRTLELSELTPRREGKL